MTYTIKQIAVDRGLIVALYVDGSIQRQHRTDTGVVWRDVDTADVDGRVVQIVVDHEGKLIALDQMNRLWQQYIADAWRGPKAPLRWKPVLGPGDEPQPRAAA